LESGTFGVTALTLVLVVFFVVAACEIHIGKTENTAKIQRKSYGFIELKVDKIHTNKGLLVLERKEQNYYINPQRIHTIVSYKTKDRKNKKGVEIGISNTSGFIITNIDIDSVLKAYEQCQNIK